MPDVWSTVAALDAAMQERLVGVLETRGADPQQQALRRAFLGDIRFPAGARVLEVGCGTGVLTRLLACWPNVAAVVGVDPAAVLLALARGCGFEDARLASHGFVETTEGGYMLTVIDRGADFLRAFGQIGEETATALKTEARRRIAAGSFFGHVAYGGLVARKPA